MGTDYIGRCKSKYCIIIARRKYIDWLIDWCLMPAIFQLYRGMNKFYVKLDMKEIYNVPVKDTKEIYNVPVKDK